jgi:uncharacterized protein YdaU (DUF1376 family)
MRLDWFPFYWRDFDDGTREMTNEEVGAYWRLLYYQWQYGSIPADKELAARITGERFDDRTWARLLSKFVPDKSVPGDRLVNLRMQAVRSSQEARYGRRIESARLNGQKGGLARAERLRSLAGSEPLSEPVANGQANRQASAKRNSSRLKSKKEEDNKPTGISSLEGNTSTDLRGARARHAPPDFDISDGIRTWAAKALPRVSAESLDLWMRKELEKFKDHEFNTPKGKRSWEGTFRNWLRRCLEIGNLPAGTSARSVDEEKHRAEVLKTAAIFNMTRQGGEEWAAFEERVNERNKRRLEALGK